MARKPGDKGFSARENRLIAEKKVLQARYATARAQVKVKNARIRELREKLEASKKKAQ